ncbi:Mobile element protein [Azospirillum melinis]
MHGYLHQWAWDGTLERIHHDLYQRVREKEGREASPTAAVLDSQSVRAAEKGGLRQMNRAGFVGGSVS